jgi:exodeoxyribonuclease-3
VKIATWNINSVRFRMNLVTRFLRKEEPDVLCLQETKVIDELFPAAPLAKLGYVHQAINGQKSYHGVAVLSRLPFHKSGAQSFCGKSDARHMGVTFENGLELHNFYVPAGGDIPDAQANEKFAHKLNFLREMAQIFGKRKDRGTPVVLVGDLNVAPLENDVWSHKQLLKIVSHTPVETQLLGEAKAAFDWIDVARDEFVAHDQKLYSWWSYRAADWRAANKGRRLDHIWTSQGLKGAANHHAIHKDIRGWKQASDHVPVVVNFAI